MRFAIGVIALATCIIETPTFLGAQAKVAPVAQGCPIRFDWRQALQSAEALSEPYYAKLANELKQSLVPTEREAISRAIGASGTVDARVTWEVSSLIRLGRDDQDLGQAGSLVWEVHVRTFAVLGGTEGVVWVGTQTGKARLLR